MSLEIKALNLAIFALCFVITNVNAVSVHIEAIQPTASGQIGVNLVDPIPAATALVGKIGKNTEYLTDIGSTISWIGPNPSFITKTTVTLTNSAGALATTTQEASVIVDQDTDGNFNILLGPDLRTKLIEIAEKVPACAAKKRAVACGYRAFTEAVAQSGPIVEVAEIENAMPAGRLVIPANDIAQLIALFKAGAGATVSPAAAVGGGTLGLLYILYDQWNSNQAIPLVLNVPNTVAGTATATATPSATSSACPDSTDTPDCLDQDCQGDAKKLCTVGDKKGCECARFDSDTSTDIAKEWMDLRSIVDQIVLSTESAPVPVCRDNNKVALETSLWKAIMVNVCASQPLDADISAIQTARDVDFPGYDGWSFALSWRHNQGDCQFGCEEMFGGFLSSTQCSYDSHTFSGSGINTQACGNATFVVNQPISSPISSSITTSASSPHPTTSQPAGPAQGVPHCGNGLFFAQSDAAESIHTYCTQLQKDKSWYTGPQSRKFSNVKIYNSDGSVNSGQELSLSISSDNAWCPADSTVAALAATMVMALAMTVERCVANFLIGVDGCAPFVATGKGPFLKTVGMSFEDCISWQVDVVQV